MRKALLIAALMLVPTMTGCTIADWCFATFGEAYSDGGYSSADRERDFDSRVEASQAARKYGIAP